MPLALLWLGWRRVMGILMRSAGTLVTALPLYLQGIKPEEKDIGPNRFRQRNLKFTLMSGLDLRHHFRPAPTMIATERSQTVLLQL